MFDLGSPCLKLAYVSVSFRQTVNPLIYKIAENFFLKKFLVAFFTRLSSQEEMEVDDPPSVVE